MQVMAGKLLSLLCQSFPHYMHIVVYRLSFPGHLDVVFGERRFRNAWHQVLQRGEPVPHGWPGYLGLPVLHGQQTESVCAPFLLPTPDIAEPPCRHSSRWKYKISTLIFAVLMIYVIFAAVMCAIQAANQGGPAYNLMLFSIIITYGSTYFTNRS